MPFSSFFASNEPFNAPLPALTAGWFVACIFMLSAPLGDVFLFMLNCKPYHTISMTLALFPDCVIVSSYTAALVNTAVAAGLLMLYTPTYRVWNWSPPFQAYRWAVIVYLISNLFLVCVPLVPPSPGTRLYLHLPYWVSRGSIAHGTK